MKITCNREQLLSVFQTVAAVAPARSPKAILQNVKLDVTPHESVLTATDMEIGIRHSVTGVEIESPGSILLPVGRFGSILRESSDETLLIEADNQGIVVQGQHSQFKLPGSNPDEFPTVATFEEEDYYEIPSRVMKTLIKRTIFATDTENSRYALGGVLLDFESDKVTAVGTDGRRLSKMEGSLTSHGNIQESDQMTIVPSRSLNMLDRSLADDESLVCLATRENDILVKSENGVIYSRLVEGRFPKWRDVLPDRQGKCRIDVSVGALFSTLRQAAIVTSDESRGIDFTFGGGSLVMTILTADVGQSRVEMPISYEGDPITITLDHRYVADFLKTLSNDQAFEWDVEDGEAAALFSTGDGYGYVIMPLSRDR